MTIEQLAREIDAEIVGDSSLDLTAANTLENATAGQVSFLANPKYERQLATTRASAVIVSPKVSSPHLTLLKTKDPYYAFMRAMELLHGHRRHPHAGVHPKAHVEPTASVGEGSILYPGVYVGPRTRVGRDCILYANAVVYDDCILGDRVTLHAGSVIGNDGYGYATHAGAHHKIPQIGNVIVEDDVEIGANCVVERAVLGATRIGRGTKIGNLVVVGHACDVGEHALLVSQVGIAGSTTLGRYVTLAGQVGVAGHLHLGDQVIVGAQAGVTNDLEDKAVVMGSPAMPVHLGRRVYTLFTQLPELFKRIKNLEKKVDQRPDP